MQELVYDEEFRVYSSKGLIEFNKAFINHTRKCFDRFKNLFDIESLSNIDFYLFDDLEAYREDYRKRLGKEPPEYSRGNFGKNSAHIVIDKELLKSSDDYFKKARAIGAHEGFHIFYRDLIYSGSDRIVWFDEGAAQYFSNEKDFVSQDEFKKFYLGFRKGYKTINNINERIQGNKSVPDDKIFMRKGVINGYSISYLALRYLVDTKGEEYVRTLMKDRKQILKCGETIITDMMTHYDRIFGLDKLQEKD